MKSMLMPALAGLALLCTSAAVQAQDSSYKPGPYSDVSAIEVLPGQFENYMDYLKTTWKKNQEFAKSKGWIIDYQVLVNNYPRDGEPDLYLVVRYAKQYTAEEQLAQQKEFEAFSKQDAHQADAASGQRAVMRKLKGVTQLQEAILK